MTPILTGVSGLKRYCASWVGEAPDVIDVKKLSAYFTPVIVTQRIDN